MTLRSPILALAMLVGATNLADAQAPRKVDSVVLRNTTSMTIHYEVKWGAESWKPYSLLPGQETAHFAGVTSLLPPLVQIRLDTDLTDMVFARTYDVSTLLVVDPFNGRRYAFGLTDGGRSLAVFNDDVFLNMARRP